jgi:hypothetical protein
LIAASMHVSYGLGDKRHPLDAVSSERRLFALELQRPEKRRYSKPTPRSKNG